MSHQYLFSSESVSAGHPDKIADQISDTILDAFLARDPNARVACETLVADGHITLAGEFKTNEPGVFAEVRDRAADIARQVLRDIGYRDAESGIDPERCDIRVRFNRQSPDISRGVDRADGVIGAGDQGLVFGYAAEESPERMPYPITLAHQLVHRQAALRRSGALPWLMPDAKSQVSVAYRDGKHVGVDTVVLSTQHARDVSNELIRDAVIAEIVEPLVPPGMRLPSFRVLVNPAGRFEIGGPKGDTGLTGRKIIVDTYGGACPHGGGAFSGKDPTKIDRSGAYMARNIAKTIVHTPFARRCTVQIAYAIGVAEPVSLMIDTHGTSIHRDPMNDRILESVIRSHFDLTPAGITSAFDLCRPIYRQTAAYGHFGRKQFPWEEVTKEKEVLHAFTDRLPFATQKATFETEATSEHEPGGRAACAANPVGDAPGRSRVTSDDGDMLGDERQRASAAADRQMLQRFTGALANGKQWADMDPDVRRWWWNRY
jgi:S-adenosylmethionine synthetase